MRTVLLCQADPFSNVNTQTNKEAASIQSIFSQRESTYKLETATAARFLQVPFLIQKCKPDIIHFAVPGLNWESVKDNRTLIDSIRDPLAMDFFGKQGLYFEDSKPSNRPLFAEEAFSGNVHTYARMEHFKEILEQIPIQILCIFFSCPISLTAAKELLGKVSYIIGYTNLVSSTYAVSFAESFYEYFCKLDDIEEAFHKALADNPIDSKNSGIPKLITRSTPIRFSRPLSILHLSDLHIMTEAQAELWHSQLNEDLHQIGCPKPDVLLISGDIGNRAFSYEYEAAHNFIKRIGIDEKRIVIVPGNHDVSWTESEKAYPLVQLSSDEIHILDDYEQTDQSPFVLFNRAQRLFFYRDDEVYETRFKDFSSFYQNITSKLYPSNYADQFSINYIEQGDILILGLNSSWQIDHFNRSYASIHPNAVSRALQIIRDNPIFKTSIKIATWHHPIHYFGDDRIKKPEFVERLARAGFRFILHGHIHESQENSYHYDIGDKRVRMLSGGTFGAPMNEWSSGVPLQYNFLFFDNNRVTILRRYRKHIEGAWQPDKEWTIHTDELIP